MQRGAPEPEVAPPPLMPPAQPDEPVDPTPYPMSQMQPALPRMPSEAKGGAGERVEDLHEILRIMVLSFGISENLMPLPTTRLITCICCNNKSKVTEAPTL